MKSIKYFKELAEEWDNMRKTFFSENIRKKVFSQLKFDNKTVVVDLGAGTGFISEGLVDKSVKIIAVDQSKEMLLQMQQKFKDYSQIDYRVGDAFDLPIETESVDYVFANMYLHHVEEPLLAIKEVYRILKQNGIFIITDLDEHEFEFLRTEQHDVWLGFKRKDISNWFELAGFKNVRTDCLNENCCSNSETSDEKANVSIFIAEGIK